MSDPHFKRTKAWNWFMFTIPSNCDGILTAKIGNDGFQLYATTVEILVSPIPDSLPLENAVVLPVSISTAATALFVTLQAPFPSLNPIPTGKKVLIWGGSSSVGCSAIQLAVAAGFDVIATASQDNHDLVRGLGAAHVFDYRDPDVLNHILPLVRPGDLVLDCISIESTQTICAEILKRIGGGILPVVLPPIEKSPEGVVPIFGKSDCN